MSVILMTTLFCKTLILQWETSCWSPSGLIKIVNIKDSSRWHETHYFPNNSGPYKLVFDRRGFIVFSGAEQISAFGSFHFVVSLCFAINVKVDFLKVLRFSFPVPVVSSPARFCRRKHKKSLLLALRAREKIWARLVGESNVKAVNANYRHMKALHFYWTAVSCPSME